MDIGDIKYLEVREAPKVLRLSEAMRIGAKIRPQGCAQLFNNGRSCALGAAYEGKTGKQCKSWEYSAVFYEFPAFLGPTDGAFPALAKTIYRMNDKGVKREEIADWLESEGY